MDILECFDGFPFVEDFFNMLEKIRGKFLLKILFFCLHLICLIVINLFQKNFTTAYFKNMFLFYVLFVLDTQKYFSNGFARSFTLLTSIFAYGRDMQSVLGKELWASGPQTRRVTTL